MQALLLSLVIISVVGVARVHAQDQILTVTPPSVYAEVGSNYSVTCSCDCQQILQFTFSNEINPPDRTRYTVTSARNLATLSVTGIQVSDAAVSLACQTVGGQSSTPVGVTVYLATATNTVAQIGETKSASLMVNVLALNNAFEKTTLWYRGDYPNGVALVNNTAGYTMITSTSNITGTQFKYNYTYVLSVNKPDLTHAGRYYLLLISTGGVYKNVYLNTYPVLSVEPVPEGGRSFTTYDGSTFSVSCLAQGYPQPSSVSWTIDFVDDKPSVKAEDWPRATLSLNRLNQTNGTLQIDNIDYTERAYFACSAITTVGNSSVSYLVRVKDPLAALWPAIGVIIEIVVLVAIIVIYEKFKDRFSSEGNDDEDDGRNDAGRSDSHALTPQSDVELRQRSVR